MPSGPLLFWPETVVGTDGSGGSTWAIVGSDTLRNAIVGPSADPHNSSYIWTAPDAAAGSTLALTFASPAKLYGTPTGVRVSLTLASYLINGQIGGSRTVIVRSGAIGADIFSADVAGRNTIGGPGFSEGIDSPWVTTSFLRETNPSTGLPWTLAAAQSILTSAVTVETGFFAPSETGIAISNLYIEILGVSHIPGSGRTLLPPNLGGFAFVCSICGLPFHEFDTLIVREPRHPHFGRRICRDDYDAIDPETPSGPDLTEGDLGPEDE